MWDLSSLTRGQTCVPCMERQILFIYFFIWLHLVLAEKAMAPHSSTRAWKIPWAEEPGRLQSMGSLRVGHNWATSLSLFTLCIEEGNGNPLQCSCLENPRDGGAWWAAVCGVAQSQTRLKRLSSSSSSSLSCGMWDLVPQTGIKLGPLAMGVCRVWATGPPGKSLQF